MCEALLQNLLLRPSGANSGLKALGFSLPRGGGGKEGGRGEEEKGGGRGREGGGREEQG